MFPGSALSVSMNLHIPDYLLMTSSGLVVVDVKPRHRLARPEWRGRSGKRGR